MYNKIFTKILDSSVWLESNETRIVWLTMLASMDQDGFCQFAAPANLAHRAIVTLPAAEAAIKVLEGPDEHSSDPDNQGRRIERVDGGWMVLNSSKYRDIVTAAESRNKNRERVQRFRKKLSLTPCTGHVMPCNDLVMQSEAYAEAEARNPLPPLGKSNSPSAQEQNPEIVELDIYSAARGLGEKIGMGHSGGKGLHKLTSAIQQAQRRWPDKRIEQVVDDIVTLWREYLAQGHHAPVALHNWLETVGRFIDSDDWKKKPVEEKAQVKIFKKPSETPSVLPMLEEMRKKRERAQAEQDGEK